MNIILVVFDSLRKDCIQAYGQQPFWGKVHTPHFDSFAKQSLLMTRAYPESLPTLPTRRALYTGRRVFPFHNADYALKGDFHGAPGWGPIPEEQSTLAELLQDAGYRTGLIADVYHMFKPSKNYARGFDQWLFLRGQETDKQRSGPRLSQKEIDHWLPKELQNPHTIGFIQQALLNMHDRTKEEDYFSARVLMEAARWLEQNQDADKFFLTIESFQPHEPWLVPAHYRKLYDTKEGREQVKSGYADTSKLDPALVRRTQTNYSASVSMCDRWFGHLLESMRVLGLLDNTLVVFTTDHGHSIGDRDYLGKRGYPSAPEVYDVPLMIRFPKAQHAGLRSDMFVQHVDITASILEAAGAPLPPELDGKPFLREAVAGKKGSREHVTVAWGSALTIIDQRWWLNCRVDGSGPLLHDLSLADPFKQNLADQHPQLVAQMLKKALAEAKGGVPEWIMERARNNVDTPGCSDLAVRK